MTRVAIIGTSHVAALKMGWDKVADQWPGTEVTFFAAPGKAARTQKLKGRVYGYHRAKPAPDEIIFGYDGGRTIDLAAFDHVLRVGDTLGEADLSDLLSRYAVDGISDEVKPLRMSRAAFDMACAALARASLPNPPWHDWDAPRLTFLARPTPSTKCLRIDSDRYDPWRDLAARPNEYLVAREIYYAHLTQEMAKRRIGLLRQPDETIAPCGLTDERFGDGAAGMIEGKALPDEDCVHMNAEYGALALRAYLAPLTAQPKAAATA